MKIAFFANAIVPVHANILEERPLGGTETALVRLAEELKKRGHTVYVFTPLNNPPVSDPLYLPTRAIGDLKKCDVFVGVREWNSLFVEVGAKRKFFWSGDDVNLVQTIGIGDRRVAKQIDGILCASKWHAERMANSSGFPKNKCFAMPHAVKKSLFEGIEPRSRLRLIYSSTPYRGLEHLAKIFPEIRKRVPGAELHICSGLNVYQGTADDNQAMQQETKRILDLFTNLDGCLVHGNLKQSELARHFMRASILAYPNTFPETGCITALEAQAAGCAIVASKLGALPETVADAGILIEGDATTLDYQSKFTDAVCNLLTNNTTWQKLSEHGLQSTRDWSDVALDFERLVTS